MSNNIIRQDIVAIDFDIDYGELKQVSQEVDNLKKELLGGLNDDAFGDMAKECKKASDSVREIKGSVDKTSAGISSATKQWSSDMREVAAEADNAKGETDDLTQSLKKATKVNVGGLESDLKEVKDALSGGEREAKGFKNSLKKIGKASVSKVSSGLSKVKTHLTTGATKAKAFLVSLKAIDNATLSKIQGKIRSISDSLGRGLVTAAQKAAKAIAAITAAVTAAVGAVAVMGVKYNAQMETYQTSFEVMTGSSKKAASITKELQTMGAKTPFEMTDLADTTQLLMQYGFTADDALNRMSMLGDISQGSADKMNRIAMAYGQMSSAGKVQLEDVKQMIEAGFSPLQEISETTGESMASLYDRISKGKMSVDEITQSMKRATSKGGKYFKSMEKQSKTFNGQLSTMKDNLNQFVGTLTKGLTAKLTKKVLPQLNEFIGKLSTAFEKGGISGLLDELGSVGKAIQGVIDKFKAITKNTKKMDKLKKVWESLKDVFETTVDLAGFLVEKFLDFATAESTLDALKTALDGINGALKWCKKHWGLIESAIVGVVGVIAGLKLGGFISDIGTALSKLKLVKTELSAMQSLGITVGITLMVTGIALEGKGIMDSIREGLNLNNFGEMVGGALLTTGGAASFGGALAAWIAKAFAGSKITAVLLAAAKNLGLATAGAAGAAIAASVAAIIAGIPMFITGIWDAIKNGISWLSSLLVGAGATLAGAGIGALIGSLGGPIGTGIGALIGLAVGLVTDGILAIVDIFKNGLNWTNGIILAIVGVVFAFCTPILGIPALVIGALVLVVKYWDKITAWIGKAASKIAEFFSNMWSKICETPVGEWINSKIIQPVIQFFVGLWNSVRDGAISAWNSICSFFSTIGSWINANIIQPVKNFFVNFFYFLVGLAVVIWEGIKAVFVPVASWVNTNIIQPVVNFFVGLWNKIVGIATSVWTSICTIWGQITSWVNTNIIQPVVLFFTNLWTSITTIVSNVWTSICTIWGMIASWVSTNIIQPVILFFTNLWTKITTIVSNVWNTICSIWGMISGWVSANVIEPIKNFFSDLWSSITQTVSSVKDAIVSAFQVAYDKVVGIWNGITGFFSGIWDSIKSTVNKLISKGKEALGVKSDVKGEGKGTKHAWGGLMRTQHWGQVAEDGAEMIIPLSKDKRNRGLALWRQAGRMMGVKPDQSAEIDISNRLPSYTPENSTSSYYTNTSSTEYNTYSPQMTFHISGATDERSLLRKIKRVAQEAVADVIDGVERTTPPVREV